MKASGARLKQVLILAGLSLPAVLLLEVVSSFAGSLFNWPVFFQRWAFTLGVLLAGWLSLPHKLDRHSWVWSWPSLAIAGLGVLSGIAFVLGVEAAGWALLLILFGFLLAFEKGLENGKNKIIRFLLRCLIAGLAGGFSVAVAQVESRFSEEEFFVALQGLAMAVYWLVLAFIFAVRISHPTQETAGFQPQGSPSGKHGVGGLAIRPIYLAVALVVLSLAGLFLTIRSYQQSFYPPDAPDYAQISSSQPVLCGTAPADPETYAGPETFERILQRVEANPYRGAPEYGMLALGTGELRWAQAFRKSLLQEAAAGRFTEPAQSVKYGQYEAAQRAYYYPRVIAAFPDLFSQTDEKELLSWFHAINRRALTVEWVDWLYALAFSKWPEGPYENQENGAGLLSTLEDGNLADPMLTTRNKDYMARNPRGWLQRFRVTDDAVVYQPEWMNNALYQSEYSGQLDEGNRRLSFEWLLAQALPDGSPLQYNHPGSISMADSAYPAGGWLQDGRYLWLSGRALDYLEANNGILAAKPGLEAPADLNGTSPEVGSCLLYGDSGLPNQVGPLAPDKIVFRDGWTADSAYLLLNLRFTGWHRYKATNTVTLLYQAGQLAADEMSGKRFTWLPSGRSFFRDKRVPRENLNGLSVERSGMGAVLHTLTGIGGPWAQDPPYYTTVENFTTSTSLDSSQTVIENWHGWRHRRNIYFYPRGPIVILDQAEGPPGKEAALFWHIPILSTSQAGNRFQLQNPNSRAEMLLLPASNGELSTEIKTSPEGLSTVEIRANEEGKLDLVTVYLTRDWAGAQAEITSEEGERVLLITKAGDQVRLPLPVP